MPGKEKRPVGRPRKWLNDAEKMRAWRLRQKTSDWVDGRRKPGFEPSPRPMHLLTLADRIRIREKYGDRFLQKVITNYYLNRGVNPFEGLYDVSKGKYIAPSKVKRDENGKYAKELEKIEKRLRRLGIDI